MPVTRVNAAPTEASTSRVSLPRIERRLPPFDFDAVSPTFRRPSPTRPTLWGYAGLMTRGLTGGLLWGTQSAVFDVGKSGWRRAVLLRAPGGRPHPLRRRRPDPS